MTSITKLVCSFATLAMLWLTVNPVCAAETIWRTLRIGGGWLTSIDISPDGATRVVRTDTYGAYIWDQERAEWRQLVTAGSMPGPHAESDYGQGVYELRIAPSKPSRLYMSYRGFIYRSDDRGRHWAQTAFRRVEMEPNDGFRTNGQKLAVDPANPDVAYAGTAKDGLFMTRDAGASWQTVAAIPKAKAAQNGGFPGYAGIALDPTSGLVQGRTKAVYVSSFGQGVFKSVDGGSTWQRLAGGPESVSHAKIARDSAYYAAGDLDSTVWRYWQGAWKDITPAPGVWQTVVVDPADAARLIAVREGGYLNISHDRGASWDGIIWGPTGKNVRAGGGIAWHAWTNEGYMSVGDMEMDPVTLGRLWFAEGIGFWFTDLPPGPGSPPAITFTGQSQGIEQLVATNILAPPGGKPIVASWDRPVFRIDDPEVYPETHGPDNANAIIGGWALDYAATDPTFVAGIMSWGEEKSGYSTDGGKSWTPFASYPPLERAFGGCLAVSSPQNIVWAASDNQPAFVTNNGGASWTAITLPGLPAKGESGWSFAHYLNRHIVAADRVKPGVFYLYNYLKGLYRSEDGGSTWALVHKGEIGAWTGYNAKLRSAPGKAEQLYFTAGPQSGAKPAASPFMRSNDGGATWRPVPRVLEVMAFGFGKAAKASGDPAIFIVGWVDKTYGLWRSDDGAASWTKIGDYPLGSLDEIRTVEGDKDTFGKVYIGFGGSGFAYGALK